MVANGPTMPVKSESSEVSLVFSRLIYSIKLYCRRFMPDQRHLRILRSDGYRATKFVCLVLWRDQVASTVLLDSDTARREDTRVHQTKHMLPVCTRVHHSARGNLFRARIYQQREKYMYSWNETNGEQSVQSPNGGVFVEKLKRERERERDYIPLENFREGRDSLGNFEEERVILQEIWTERKSY